LNFLTDTATGGCSYRVNFARLVQRAVAVIVEFFNSYRNGPLQ
jgi:hypothetical protein